MYISAGHVCGACQYCTHAVDAGSHDLFLEESVAIVLYVCLEVERVDDGV